MTRNFNQTLTIITTGWTTFVAFFAAGLAQGMTKYSTLYSEWSTLLFNTVEQSIDTWTKYCTTILILRI